MKVSNNRKLDFQLWPNDLQMGDMRPELEYRKIVGEFLFVESIAYESHRRAEIVGIVKWEPSEIPLGDREILAALFTRFLRLVQLLEEAKVQWTRKPQIVIGDVGRVYQAQVTLSIQE